MYKLSTTDTIWGSRGLNTLYKSVVNCVPKYCDVIFCRSYGLKWVPSYLQIKISCVRHVNILDLTE
jgi:hypothetical protein